MRKNRILVKCLNCSKDFTTILSRIKLGWGKFCSRSCQQFFQWRQKEYRENMILKHKGQISGMKGKHHTKEAKEKNRLAHLGIKYSLKSIRQGASKRMGKLNNKWKGDKVSYRSLHKWVERHLGKSDTCEECGIKNFIGHQIHWANINHEYKRNLTDWRRLCTKCHGIFDTQLRREVEVI